MGKKFVYKIKKCSSLVVIFQCEIILKSFHKLINYAILASAYFTKYLHNNLGSQLQIIIN